jgi:N-formylglutamate amidohydrolase
VVIPDYTGYRVSATVLGHEIERVTDWGVAEIFDIDGVTKTKANFSRLFCDVERFYDNCESLSARGFGIAYTGLEGGGLLRTLTVKQKNDIIVNYYEPYHEHFSNLVREKIEVMGKALIIDCHSFPDKPLGWEEHLDLPRPDICIGTEKFHTPVALSELFRNHFESKGYTVSLNHPFEGTIVPTAFYHKDSRVNSIMIEINRKLFTGNDDITQMNHENITNVKNDITDMLQTLS